MSDKNSNMTTTPNSAQPTMTGQKKDNSLLIVLIVLGVVVGLPILAIVFIFSMAFRFAGEVIDEIDDFDDWSSDYSYEEYDDQINDGQLDTVRNLWVLSTNKLITSASISQKDCRNMQYISDLSDYKGWFDPTFCSGQSISIGAEAGEINTSIDGGLGSFIYISDGTSCATYNIDLADGILYGYRFTKHACINIDMKTFPLVDTGEADSPNIHDDMDNVDLFEHDDDVIEDGTKSST